MRVSESRLLVFSQVLLVLAVAGLAIAFVRWLDVPKTPRIAVRAVASTTSDVRRSLVSNQTRAHELQRDAHFVARHNPFSPQRTDSAEVPPPSDTQLDRPAVSIPQLRLSGTVQYSSGEWRALVRGPGGDEKLLRVGQMIDQFEIKSIIRGRLTIVSPDTTLVLQMP